MRRLIWAAAAAGFLLAGCASAPEPSAETARVSVEAVLADPSRPEGDRSNDVRRKAAETLAFFEIGAGDDVFEIEAGGGYWTEILSVAVGPSGSVVMQNPPGFAAFVGDEVARRFAEGRLGNVRRMASAFDALDAPDASMDVVTWFQGPHEVFYHPQGGDALGDPARSYAEVYRILKPGGVFAVIDHAAASGAPESAGNDLHRIDPAIVVRMAEAAGFRLESRGAFLANADDPRTAVVFDPAIRGHTDQFALRFRK